MKQRDYVPLGIDLIKPEDIKLNSFIVNDPAIVSIITRYKDGDLLAPSYQIKHSTYTSLIHLIDRCRVRFEEDFNVYGHLFQLMQMIIIDGCVAYLYKNIDSESEIFLFLSKSDSFGFGFMVIDSFLDRLSVKEDDEFRPLLTDERVLLMHCCQLVSEIYLSFNTDDLIDKSSPEEVKIVFDFLENELGAKELLEKFQENYAKIDKEINEL